MRYFHDKHYLNSSVGFAMKSVFGLGKSRQRLILRVLGHHPDDRAFKLKSLDSYEFEHFKNLTTTTYKVGGELQAEIKQRRVTIQETKSRRALMFEFGLPCRGQRTHTNAGTASRRKRGSENYTRRFYGHSFRRRKRRKDRRSKFIR
jgi:small subunit ribosomal protein S13